MSEKKFINLEKDPEYVDDYVVFKSTKFGKTYYLDSSVKEYTEYELEAYKKKRRKKAWMYVGIFVLFCLVLSVIEGYQNDELVKNGKVKEVMVLGKHIEEEYIILKHPTLELFDNNKMKKIWVKQELYDKVYPTDKVRIIEYKGEVKLDPRYEDKDLVIQKYKFGR
ncbi:MULTISPECIES: hypothetical protein [Bacillus cereus group]|uniref:Uncharacterized protein n=1 Tax=Bacillus proteolyticus TaxID=2026192 RepID=A0ABV3IEL4_9BACI|nr:hypothetical protein [Bacillus cereus group sp. N8]MBJ8107617.1 hypothetical protein [Bacillus cereus group sp. N8]